MKRDGVDRKLISMLRHASSLELLRLGAAIDQLLADPRHPSRNDFRCGDKVAFELRYLQTQVGTIVHLDQGHATVDTGDRTRWRIDLSLLRHLPGA